MGDKIELDAAEIEALPRQQDYRDVLGRAVRRAWVEWAKQQPNPKPSWLVDYDDLSEPDKEADRQIGEAIRSLTLREAAQAVLDEQMEGAEPGGDHPYARAIENSVAAIEALSASKAVPEAPVASSVLGDENDLHSVAHALDIGGIGTPYRAYQGSLYCDYQPHRIADFQDYGLALAATVLFNNAKAIKAALASPPKAYEGPKVKELEWEEHSLGWFADTPFGAYWVSSNGFTTWWARFNGSSFGLPGFRTEAEAKAAAQADYEKRILSALIGATK